MTTKKAKLVFDFKVEGLNENDVDKILTIRRSDVCVVKLPSLKCEDEEAQKQMRRDLLNVFVSGKNDHYPGDAIGTEEDTSGKLRPVFFIEPLREDRAIVEKMEVVTGKYRPNLSKEPLKQNKENDKKGNLTLQKKQREKGTQYDDIIRSLSKLITNLKKSGLSGEHLNQYIKDKEYFQRLQKEEQERDDIKILLKDGLKINQIIDRQICDLCEYVIKKRGDITKKKCFDLVAKIMTAKGRIGVDDKKVKNAYWNFYK